MTLNRQGGLPSRRQTAPHSDRLIHHMVLLRLTMLEMIGMSVSSVLPSI